MQIAIIGGGNLGVAIARGLKEALPDWELAVSRRNADQIADLQALGIRISSNNSEISARADVIILAVKPHQVAGILEEIRPLLERQILVSVATGYSLGQMRQAAGPDISLFRAMPNTAISQRQSLTCIASDKAGPEQREQIREIFDQLGETVLIDESMMDAATVLGACGIAFALRYIRASMQGGIQIGFDSNTALKIASQTVKGAATLLLQEATHPEREIDKVTTPQGCTISGLNEMEHQGFSSALIKGILSSYQAIDEMKKRPK